MHHHVGRAVLADRTRVPHPLAQRGVGDGWKYEKPLGR